MRNNIATLAVLKFPDPEGANNALARFVDLQKQHLIKIHDAAIVSWPAGSKSLETKDFFDLAGIDALSAVFYPIGKDFIKRIGSQVTEGTSALFLMTTEAVMKRVVDALKSETFELIATNLSKEQEQKLREAFG